MKKMSILLSFLILVSGLIFYSYKVSSVNEGYVSYNIAYDSEWIEETVYIKAEKDEIRSYVREYLSPVYTSIKSARSAFMKSPPEYQQEVNPLLVSLNKYFDDKFEDIYEETKDFTILNNLKPVPIEMKESHEKLLESVYYMGLAAEDMDRANLTEDFSYVFHNITLMDEALEDVINFNEHLIWNSRSHYFDYLTSQSNKVSHE